MSDFRLLLLSSTFINDFGSDTINPQIRVWEGLHDNGVNSISVDMYVSFIYYYKRKYTR